MTISLVTQYLLWVLHKGVTGG